MPESGDEVVLVAEATGSVDDPSDEVVADSVEDTANLALEAFCEALHRVDT